MPNWCANNVTLRHSDPAQIQRAVESYQQGRFLNEFVPIPEDVAGTDAWYQWCVNNWGTKWDIGGNGEFIEQPDDHSIVLRFDSAWSPPIAAYGTLLEAGFELRATYFEPGMCFAGVWDNGNDDYVEYNALSIEEIRTLYPDLDQEYSIADTLEDMMEETEPPMSAVWVNE